MTLNVISLYFGAIVLIIVIFLALFATKKDLSFNIFQQYWEVVLFILPENVITIVDYHHYIEEEMKSLRIFNSSKAAICNLYIRKTGFESAELEKLVEQYSFEKSDASFYWHEYIFAGYKEKTFETKQVAKLSKTIAEHNEQGKNIILQLRYPKR
ncbi:MAG: hypothetical protein Q4C12_02185 [Clostridia bacterium]|nr:hypothetical protein [Clostridia bacterium]